MSTTLDDRSALAPGPEETGRRRGLGWLLVGLLALLVFELTADPALAVAVGCVKFGGEGLATAQWLRRVDPDRRRGRVVARFYTAAAFWHVAGVATQHVVHRRLRLAPLLGGRRGLNRELLASFLVAVIAFALAGMLSLWAVASAWRVRASGLARAGARWARKRGEWPPSLFDVGRAPIQRRHPGRPGRDAVHRHP